MNHGVDHGLEDGALAVLGHVAAGRPLSRPHAPVRTTNRIASRICWSSGDSVGIGATRRAVRACEQPAHRLRAVGLQQPLDQARLSRSVAAMSASSANASRLSRLRRNTTRSTATNSRNFTPLLWRYRPGEVIPVRALRACPAIVAELAAAVPAGNRTRGRRYGPAGIVESKSSNPATSSFAFCRAFSTSNRP